MANPRAFGLEDGHPGLKGKQVGTTSDGRPIVAWPASTVLYDIIDPIETHPSTDDDWSGVGAGDEDNVSMDGDSPPGVGGDSWRSTGTSSITSTSTSLYQQGEEVCSWVKSDGGRVGLWFGVQDENNLYYLYLSPGDMDSPPLIDGFEDQSLSEWTQDSGGTWSIVSAADGVDPIEGDYLLKATTDTATDKHAIVSFPGDGLANYPAPGDTFYTWARTAESTKSDEQSPWLNYGVQNASLQNGGDGYRLGAAGNLDYFSLHRSDGGTLTNVAQVTYNWSLGAWHKIHTEWTTAGDHNCTLYDSSGSEIVSIAGTDGTYGSGGVGVEVGVGNATNNPTTNWYDMAALDRFLGELELGYYDAGAATTLDRAEYNFHHDTWYLLNLAWGSNGGIRATAHEKMHNDPPLVELNGTDTRYSSGSFGVDFEEAGQGFDHLKDCDDAGIIENFEDVDLADWTLNATDPTNADISVVGEDSNNGRNVTVTPPEGDKQLRFHTPDTSQSALIADYPTIRSPEPGDTFEGWLMSNCDGIDISDEQSPGIVFGASQNFNHKAAGDGYTVRIHQKQATDTFEYFSLERQDAGSRTKLAEASGINLSLETWYRFRDDWKPGGDMTAELYDEAGTQLASLAATDETYTDGYFGFLLSEGNNTSESQTSYVDDWRFVV